jgi:hypothetical protein
MVAPSLDNEFMEYWLQLTVVEKESLINVAKNYVQLKESEDVTSARQKLVQMERDAYLRGEGKSYSWEQVRQMTIDKDKRNAL